MECQGSFVVWISHWFRKENEMDKKILFRNILLWLVLIGLVFPLRVIYTHYATLLSLAAPYTLLFYAFISGVLIMCMNFSSRKINVIIFLFELFLVVYSIWNPIFLFSSIILVHGTVLGTLFLSIFLAKN